MTKMSPAALEARREYYRRWRRENPEKVREIRARYWEKKAAKEGTPGGGTDQQRGS